RWGASDSDQRRRHSAEVVALKPDLILASSAVIVEALQQQTKTIPIVFVGTIHPVGGGLVASLAHPGANATGFLGIEYSIGAKWLELLKQIAPGTTRVLVFRAPTVPGSGQFGAIQSAAPSFGVEVRPFYSTEPNEIERALTSFAPGAGNGVIVTAGRLPGGFISEEMFTA